MVDFKIISINKEISIRCVVSTMALPRLRYVLKTKRMLSVIFF